MVRLAVIPGDGIGPEVMAEALPLLEWVRGRGRDLEWKFQPWGADRFLATGETLPEQAFEEIRDDYDAVLFGAVGDPRIPDNCHAEAILLRLRQDLELGVNYRPCFPAADALVPIKDVAARDIRIEVFRENTEGPYCLRGRSGEGSAVDEAHHSEAAVRRLLEAAFTRAEAAKRPLTLAHKANVLKHGHGLWMRVFQECRAAHPAVEASTMHADALLCALVRRPAAFDVIAGDNLIGDLVSDLTAAFMGGMGLAPSLSTAPHQPFRCSVLAEPVHGSAPDLVGTGKANPGGAILSAALLFRHLGWEDEASTIEFSVAQALREGAATPDLGGTLTTSGMGTALRTRLS
ncbi:MAG TPA: isocitrate/isopropylmalate family dehydrogenase [Holophagaceae bacterium]|nr:isocitrate/isopropylmalate family dehydrogenase [Holophagaceae bacterium]